MKNLIVMIFFVFVSFVVNAQQSYNEYINSASKEFANGEYKAALNMLHDAKALASTEQERASVSNSIGWTYYNAGNNELARKNLLVAFDKAIEAGDAKLAQKVSNNLGFLEYSEGNLEEARQYFSNEWSENSDSSITYLSMIREQEEQEKVNSIIASGVAFRIKKDFQSAVAEYDKALNISPDNVRALEYKGYALYRLGNYSGAIKTLEKAREIEPSRLNVIINLLKSYCASGSDDAANSVIEQSRELLLRNEEVLRNDGEFSRVCVDIQLVES